MTITDLKYTMYIVGKELSYRFANERKKYLTSAIISLRDPLK
jgi:hypothetical protein